MVSKLKFQSKVWVYPGMAAWRFLILPKKESGKIKTMFAGLTGGFGSLPVKVTVGQTTWETSIFPDKKKGAYLLPLKAEVRKKEKITDNKLVNFIIEIKI